MNTSLSLIENVPLIVAASFTSQCSEKHRKKGFRHQHKKAGDQPPRARQKISHLASVPTATKKKFMANQIAYAKPRGCMELDTM
ncbi:hypothetical protein [Prosthecobacter sp.]|uniref:hypothetical protein n=1 Tax=Prosthecobacter sp. TaxID=1965333 RepID=UPI002AB9A9BB|nr:hypothetical protein [Prosthecobacter sp.]MDZ4405941.1 hypothetical protein [Prosthecobacter sp.]